MHTRHIQQAGFSAVVSVVIIAFVIALTSCIGWVVYRQSLQQAAHTDSGSSRTGAPTTQSTYLDIKELGVKIRLDDSIKDVVYSYNPSDSSPVSVHDIGKVSLSTSSLIARDPNCKPAPGVYPLGLIDKFTNDLYGDKLKLDGTTLFKFGQYYYFLAPPQSPCSTDPSVNALAAQQRATFLTDFKTIQPDQ